MDDRSSNNRGAWAWLAGLALGVCLAVGSWAWANVTRPTLAWSPKQAEEYKAANEELHAARSGQTHAPAVNGATTQDVDDKAPDLAAAQKRFNDISAALDDARDARAAWGTWGVAAGFAVMIACGLGFLATRRE